MAILLILPTYPVALPLAQLARSYRKIYVRQSSSISKDFGSIAKAYLLPPPIPHILPSYKQRSLDIDLLF
jgi:hypothetical protein